jgi:hypothetical protein
MNNAFRDDILLTPGLTAPARRTPLAAFVPIGIALFGVALIMFGGLSARDRSAAREITVIDPITTGSIVSEPQKQGMTGHVQRWE